jgi:hypothetical protein
MINRETQITGVETKQNLSDLKRLINAEGAALQSGASKQSVHSLFGVMSCCVGNKSKASYCGQVGRLASACSEYCEHIPPSGKYGLLHTCGFAMTKEQIIGCQLKIYKR